MTADTIKTVAVAGTLFLTLAAKDATVAPTDWFPHVLEALAQLGALLLFIERRITRLETKLGPLWEKYNRDAQDKPQPLWPPARD